MATNNKPNVQHFRVFGCPAIFKRYEISDKGIRKRNKYIQQGMRGIFVGIPDDSAGWLFYVPDARKTYISMDAIFDENFTSPLCMPDLPFKGSIRLRKIQNTILNQEAIKEETGLPSGEEETYPSDSDLPPPSSDKLINSEDDESILLHS